MTLRFTKFHGYGNDYLVIEAGALTAEVTNLNRFAREICDRHYGAGADGIAVVDRSDTDEADFRVRIFNPDGSEAGLSGNGTRCAASYLFYRGLWTRSELRLITKSGVKRYFLRDQIGAGNYLFDSELGKPAFESVAIPFLSEGPLDKVVNQPLVVGGETFSVTALGMGNPNCSIFVDDFEALDWRSIGKAIETHEQFPERTNVEFIKILDRDRIELRIWERGVGETTASGTCSCAAAVAAMINGFTERQVEVRTPGGTVNVRWQDDDEVVLTGIAEVVYQGEWLVGS
ncbi:MAG TPA: diaminopimelate epimerase [Pyrinomonadaceae bacterium]|nr:diaminopimelate epimerase [Pyrinomonadaceae bacterium]